MRIRLRYRTRYKHRFVFERTADGKKKWARFRHYEVYKYVVAEGEQYLDVIGSEELKCASIEDDEEKTRTTSEAYYAPPN